MIVLNAVFSDGEAYFHMLMLLLVAMILIVVIFSNQREDQIKTWASMKWSPVRDFYFIYLHKFRFLGVLKKGWKKRAFAQDLYVFWGVNDASINLAKSIETAKNCEKTYQIVFVAKPSESDTASKLRALKSGSILLRPKHSLIDVHNEIAVEDDNQYDYFDRIGLGELGEKCNRYINVSFFFLSDDDASNVQEMLIMKNYFMKQARYYGKPHLYCRARRNEHNKIYEEQAYLQNEDEQKVKVHIVDDSSLAVLNLKMNEAYHPVQFVQVNEKAQVVSPFNALILGFGQTGRDALRFLYEFGSFSGVGSPKEERSPLHITAIDRNMENIKGDFLVNAPSLTRDYNVNRTEFRQCDVHSTQFWNDLIEKIPTLNYIVIALGSDEENIAMLINVYRLCLKYRYEEFKMSNKEESPAFSIFVRVYKKEYEQEYTNIQTHLNSYNIQENSNVLNKDYIHPFGSIKDIYTYDMIINERTRKEAITFAYVYDYQDKINLSQRWTKEEECAAANWWEKKHTVKMLKELIDIRRQEEQDMSNSWHVGTKLALIEKAGISALTRDSWPSKRKGESLVYDVPPEQQEIIDNIAFCEHLRWNALSELQGYEPYVGHSNKMNKMELGFRKLHFCLRPWKISWTNDSQGKDTMLRGEPHVQDKIKYDYNTIDTSIYVDKIRRQNM